MAFTGPTGGTGPALQARTLAEFLDQKAGFDEDAQLQWFLGQLRGHSPAQIRNFVGNNVTDLASARTLLTLLTLYVASQANI